MESFMESLNRLKEVHEKEVLGLQNKLLELNSERCRDAQRIEELFAKNHQLREQQKALKENLRVLENRLRAGLCDRCMVTQELARKKQQEFESSHLQSLQHIFTLTNKMSGLKAENKALREEVKRLQGLEDRPKLLAREGTSDPASPLLRPSPSSWKAITEKPPGVHEETEEDHPGTGPRGEGAVGDGEARRLGTCRTMEPSGQEAEPPAPQSTSQALPSTAPPTEKPVGYQTSPVANISPGANLPEPRTPDMSPQRISNQLHGTIAVVRPGSGACPADRSSTNGTPPPPPTRSSPPSPTYEHSLPLDSFLRASRPSATTCESLKHSLQVDRLCLLNRHLHLHLQSPRSSPLAPAAATHGPQPQGLKAGEAEAWEEPAGLLGLPSALGGMQDPRLEGALQLLLVQQQLRARALAGSARLRGPLIPGETPLSPSVGSDSEDPENNVTGAALTTAVLPGGRHPKPAGRSSPTRREAAATQNYAPDKPLDLSDWGRGRDAPKPANQPGSLSPTTAHTPSPEPSPQVGPLTHSPWALSNGIKETRALEPEEPPTPTDPSHPLPGRHPRLSSLSRTGGEVRGRLQPSPHPQRPDASGPPEPRQAETQRPESDDLDEPDTSDSEEGPSSEAGAKPSMPGEGPRCFCPKEPRQTMQQKRKQASDLGGKASKKPSQGRRKLKEPLTAAEESGSPKDAEDHSPSPGNSSWEET